MSSIPSGSGETDTRDGEILADLFDALLQEILEGNTPDLAKYHADRPDLRERIQKTWALACSVAGRREPSRPVLGGYEIVRELGHGGMGTVYLARHQALQREVAIKVLPHSLAMSPRAKQRFLEEARALARLRHDHVVHIHRIIDHQEMLAFEMEFIDGPSLQQVILELRQQPKPQSIEALAKVLAIDREQLGTRSSVEWLVRLGIRIARALGEVHRHGLVHRDVKPSNILLRRDGRPVLADFGLARVGDLEATQSAGFAGTPVYAAPERLRGGDADVDARADVYSLGVTLYEALTLSPPFAGSTTHEVLRRIENGHLPALRKQAPHVSRDLETVLARAMEVDLKHRYATADGFADDLERLLSLQPILARPAGPVRRAFKFVRRNQRILLSALGGALLVAGITGPVLAHRSAREEARAAALAATHTARTQVLALESLQAVATQAFAVTTSQTLQQPAATKSQLRSLATAQRGYAEALAADPSCVEARLEADVIAAVLALRAAADAGGTHSTLAAHLAPLPPLARKVAHSLADGKAAGDLRQSRGAAAADDRLAAGLLAFLLGDLVTSQICWQGLGEILVDHPLLDACLALQQTGDGSPERAYPQLFHAARQFPKATSLALAMADSALAMGDLPLAENWLATLPDDPKEPMAQGRRRLLQADLQAARRQFDAAAPAYRDLARLDPTDPTPLLRLALVESAAGRQERSDRLLQAILSRWPDLAAARLITARHALLRRDLATYLEQARHVLAQQLPQLTRGAAGQLTEILDLGGLLDLLPTGPDSHPQRARPITQTNNLPLSAWLSPAQLGAVRHALRFCQVVDACSAVARRIDHREVGITLRTIWLAGLRLPGLSLRLPLPVQAAVLAALPALLDHPTDLLSAMLMPFARTLDTPVQVVDEGPLLQVATDPTQVVFAMQLARARDTDGDSLPDICIACTAAGRDYDQGYVEIRSLQDGSLLQRFEPEGADLLFARGLCVLEDIDGDLCDDLLIGSPSVRGGADGQGEVELRSGRTGLVLWRITGDVASFGVTVARLGDVDGDGKDDFVVGAPLQSLQGGDRGSAYIASGANGAILHELPASRSGAWFGGKVAGTGDIDGDRIADVLVGGNFGQAPGLVVLFSGASGRSLLTFAEDAVTSDYGADLNGIDDVDRDGVPDLAISAPGLSSRGKDRGRVQVLSGRTGQVLYELFGERAGDGFGIALASVRDWVGASGPSLAVSARRGGPVGTGYVRVFSAAAGQPQQTFAGGPNVSLLGHCLVPLGHLDGDRHPDLLVPMLARDGKGMLWKMSWAQTLQGRQR